MSVKPLFQSLLTGQAARLADLRRPNSDTASTPTRATTPFKSALQGANDINTSSFSSETPPKAPETPFYISKLHRKA